MKKLIMPKTIEELRKEFAGIKSCVAQDTMFGARALLFIAEKMDDLVKLNGGKTNAKRIRNKQGNEVQQRATGGDKGKEDVPRERSESPVEVHQEARS